MQQVQGIEKEDVISRVQSCKQLTNVIMDPGSLYLPTLSSSAGGSYLLGHKMAPASLGKVFIPRGERRKGRVENTLSSGALPFSSRKQNRPQRLLCLDSVSFARTLSYCYFLSIKKAGVQATLLLSSVHSR